MEKKLWIPKWSGNRSACINLNHKITGNEADGYLYGVNYNCETPYILLNIPNFFSDIHIDMLAKNVEKKLGKNYGDNYICALKYDGGRIKIIEQELIKLIRKLKIVKLLNIKKGKQTKEFTKMMIAIRLLNIKHVRDIDYLKVVDFKNIWDYRKEDLNIDTAKNMLRKYFKIIYEIREKRFRLKYEIEKYNNNLFKKDKYVYFLRDKKIHISNYLQLYNNSEDYKCAKNYSYGNDINNNKYFKIGYYGKFNLPVMMKVTWNYDVNWNYYSKRYKYPKITVDNRKVEFVTTNKFGKIEPFLSVELNGFRGNFLDKCLQIFYQNHKKTRLEKIESILTE
jgi:hypothetical protein